MLYRRLILGSSLYEPTLLELFVTFGFQSLGILHQSFSNFVRHYVVALYQFDLKDESGIGGNGWGGFCAISILRTDSQLGHLTQLHARDAKIPASYLRHRPDLNFQRLCFIVGFKNCAVLETSLIVDFNFPSRY